MIIPSLFVLILSAAVPSWEFDTPADLAAWQANGHIVDARIEDGALCGRTVDWDPFFTCDGLDIQTASNQYLLIRMKADRPGYADLFWTGDTSGSQGGLSEKRKERFAVAGNDTWQDIVVFPFWHGAPVIKRLRFDLYADTTFAIDSISVRTWGHETDQPVSGINISGEQLADWQIREGVPVYFAPPALIDGAKYGWVTVALTASQDCAASVLWGAVNHSGLQRQPFHIKGDGQTHTYNVELQGKRTWDYGVVALGLELPPSIQTSQIEQFALAETPGGPPDLWPVYVGFENGPNRAGRPASILAVVENHGGKAAAGYQLHLADLTGGLVVETNSADTQSSALNGLSTLDFEEQAHETWTVSAEEPGIYGATLHILRDGEKVESESFTLEFLPALDLPEADYVPEPQPVKTSVDVAAYYFPGWDSSVKWEPVSRIAPVRKPVLGYYDEANSEIVDWQIKWAAENGIKVFLVDWYWTAGSQHLTHWMEAYKQARYREHLDIAIMWANHNPPNTHSRDDWRKVTQEWIDNYFHLPTYYKIDGRPAIFLWDFHRLREDLGSIEEVKAALAESQEMARAAGYAGIYFAAIGYGVSETMAETLAEEGYEGLTTYHEWGDAVDTTHGAKRYDFADVAATSPGMWRRKAEASNGLTYFPVVDTGWDSRPWHGDDSLVISGRTPALFEQLLRDAKTYLAEKEQKLLILGPINEWGEGSYIEPNTEFGFSMYEAIRRVFAEGSPEAWPMNIAPVDVKLGPYDFPPRKQVTEWTFDEDARGWSAMMGLGRLEVKDGKLYTRSASTDPAMAVDVDVRPATEYGAIEFDMQLTGPVPDNARGQLFWSANGHSTTEAASVTFPLQTDGKMHTYRLDLSGHPRWRGRVGMLRFDPCSTAGIDIVIDRFALISQDS